MDNRIHTPEEEAYLRMLDQEVPDLWGRIEAGLDKAAGAEKTPVVSREERFLAEQNMQQGNAAGQQESVAGKPGDTTGTPGNVIPFDAGTKKKGVNDGKKKRTALIIGIGAAAVVLLGSLAIFGFAGQRSAKNESPAAEASPSGDMNAEKTGESAKRDMAELADDRLKAKDEKQFFKPESDPDFGGVQSDAESNEAVAEESVGDAEKAHSSQSGSEKREEENVKTDAEVAGDSAEKPSEAVAGSGPATIQELYDLQHADASVTIRIFRYDSGLGEDRPYRIAKSGDGVIWLMEEEVFLNEKDEAKREAASYFIKGDQKITKKVINGVEEYYLPE